MTARLCFLLAACLVLPGSVVAQFPDPNAPDPQWPFPLLNRNLATLAPADTLAYVELHRPDRLAEEVRKLIKGSKLDDPDRLVSRLRRSKDDSSALGAPCTLVTPEVLNELGQYQGGFLALTGFTRDGTPQMVAVLKTGRGGMASLAMRLYLASSKEIKAAGEVKGSTIYRIEGLSVACLEPPVDSERAKGTPGGVFVAQVSGAIVAGTARAAVADALYRLQGEGKSPSLADNKAFQEARELCTAPGLFAYADAPRLLRQLARMEGARDKETARRLEMLLAMLNPSSVRFVAGGLGLKDGECGSFLEVRSQQGKTLPALDWLANEKLSDDLLRTAPRDACFLLAVPVSDKLRSLDISGMIDLLPGKPFAGAREVLTRTRTLAVTGGMRLKGESESGARLVVLLEAVSEEAAKELEKLWPGLYEPGKSARPRRVRVRGEVVCCLEPKGSQGGKDSDPTDTLPGCYARCGKVLVLGWDAGAVAAALRAPGEERPLLNLPLAEATAQREAAGLVYLFSCRQLLRQTCALLQRGNGTEIVLFEHLRRMSRAMKTVPPTVLRVKRAGSSYRCELLQKDMDKAAAPVLDGLALLQGLGFQTWVSGMTLPSKAIGGVSPEDLDLTPPGRPRPPIHSHESFPAGRMSDMIPREPAKEEAKPEASPQAATVGAEGGLLAVRRINTRSVQFKVRLKMGSRPEAMPVDVYTSRDDGTTWQLLEGDHQMIPLSEEDQDCFGYLKGSVTVKVPREGVVYGFCVKKQGQAAPAPGTRPQMRVELDQTLPDAKLWGAEPEGKGRNAVRLRWEATDRNLTKEPITLEWAEQKDGPWHVIGRDLPNTGKYSWDLPRQLPKAIFLKLSVRDQAGNVGVAATIKPVILDLTPPESRVIGVRP